MKKNILAIPTALVVAVSSTVLIQPATAGEVGSKAEPGISGKSRLHIDDIINRTIKDKKFSQEEDYDEFVVDDFGEDQWTEITPNFAEMFPDGSDEAIQRGIERAPLNPGHSSITPASEVGKILSGKEGGSVYNASNKTALPAIDEIYKKISLKLS